VLLDVNHYLLGRKKGITPEQIYSHPQAMAQCRAWLERHYPNVPLTPMDSTAHAAQRASEDGKAFAIGSELAASHYNLKVIYSKIEDHPNNMTRFLVLGTKSPKRTGQDKTSLVFAVKDEPGILYKMLAPFQVAGINLSKIESRPMVRLDASKAKLRKSPGRWEYAFFIDLDGHIQSRKVRQAVDQLEKKCQFLKVLGSYPRGK
jgi:chorismate mutase/prephenate dehydratase